MIGKLELIYLSDSEKFQYNPDILVISGGA